MPAHGDKLRQDHTERIDVRLLASHMMKYLWNHIARFQWSLIFDIVLRQQ
jgi:hypothetical protein